MKRNKLIIILTLAFLLAGFNVFSFTIAQDDYLEDSYPIENETVMQYDVCSDGCAPANSDGELINCENFYWVENYIKNRLIEENATGEMEQLVDVMKVANYNLQDEINEKDKKIADYAKYKNSFYITLGLLAISWVYYLFRMRKNEK